MAIIKQSIEIVADPCRPVEEINNIISGFLRLHPGQEVSILTAVNAEVERAINEFKQRGQPAPADSPAETGNQNTNKTEGSE